MKRFFKPKGSPADPTPYPLGPPAGSYESFSPSPNVPAQRLNNDILPPGAGPVSSGAQKTPRFLNLVNNTGKDNVTPFLVAPASAPVPLPDNRDRSRSHGDLVSMDIAREHDYSDKELPSEPKISRRASMKGQESRGLFGFARRDKEKEKDKDHDRKEKAKISENPEYARPYETLERNSQRNSQIELNPGSLENSQHLQYPGGRPSPMGGGQQYSPAYSPNHESETLSMSRPYAYQQAPLPNPYGHSNPYHRDRYEPERDDPALLQRPNVLSRLTSDVSGHSSPAMDVPSADEAELLLSRSHGSATFDERVTSGRARGGSNASGRLDERPFHTRERGGSNASGRASPYGSTFLQPRHPGNAMSGGPNSFPRDNAMPNPRSSSNGTGYQYDQPQQYQQHVSRHSDSSAGHQLGLQSLAVPTEGSGQASRRSGESARNAVYPDSERPPRQSEDPSQETKGGLRAMFSRGYGKDEQEEADDGKRKKGFFGLGGKHKEKDDEKEKTRFGRSKVKRTDAEQDGQFVEGHIHPPGAVPEAGEWTHVGADRGRQSPLPTFVSQSTPVTRATSPLPPVQASPMHAGAPFVALEVGKKEREKAIREAQERTKEHLKAEKKERERAEKDAFKAEKEEQRKKGEYGSVTWAINDLCSRACAQEYPLILELCERVVHSNEDVAKEAGRAIRKAIKYGITEPDGLEEERIMATKIWLLCCMNSSEASGLRPQVTSKRFLQAVESLLIPEKDKPVLLQDSYDRLRDTLAHLNYNFGFVKGSESLRELWNKVKSKEEPDEGYPFGTGNPVYSPNDPLLRQIHNMQGTHPAMAPRQRPPPLLQSEPTYLAQIPNEQEDLTKLLREALTCKEHARVLQSALAHSKPQDFESDPIVREFYATCVRDQESLVSQMGWANAQAEKSRAERGLTTPLPAQDGNFGDRMGDLSISDEEPSLPERVFLELLAASDELTQALKLHEDLERDSRDERELKFVQEKSKTDTRMNRASMGQWSNGALSVPHTNDMAGGSRSRSPSPLGDRRGSEPAVAYTPSVSHEDHSDRYLRPYTETGVSQRSHTPDSSTEFSAPRFPSDGRSGSPTRIAGKVQGPRPIVESLRKNQHASDNSLRSSQAHTVANTANGRSPLTLATEPDQRVEDEDDRPPARPSAKALGKRKAAAKSDPEFDPDDIWKTEDTVVEKNSSEESVQDLIHQFWEKKYPTRYVYDAARERQANRQRDEDLIQARGPVRVASLHTSGGIGGSTMDPT